MVRELERFVANLESGRKEVHALRGGDTLREAVAYDGKQREARLAEHDIDLLVARARPYLLLSTLLSRAPSLQLLTDLTNLRGDASSLGLAQLALSDAARLTDADTAGREHFNVFIGVGRGEVLPYASYYLTGFLNERPLVEIRADLNRLGIERRSDVFEPEDHIGTLFEVMAGLLQGMLAQADLDRVQETDAIFTRHIAPWAHRLMDDIAMAPSAKFYRAVAAYGSTWLAIEREAMQLPV